MRRVRSRARGAFLAAAGAAVVSLSAVPLHAQTSIAGSSLAMRSSGSATLSATGYVGTYLTVPAGGATVNFTVNATPGATGAGTPTLQLVVADTVKQFPLVGSGAANYATGDIALPAGTYFVRAERDYRNNYGISRPFTVNSLSVGTTGGAAATFNNNTASGVLDTNALAAANTYVDNFRRGSATVQLKGPGGVAVLPGTPVHVDLARHAFNFGTAIPGANSTGVNAYLGAGNTAQQSNYQSRLNLNFNSIVPENMGKWASNEATRDANTMAGVDTMLNYAQSRQMRARMHNLIWGDNSNNGQQPSWVLNNNAAPNNGLLDKAYLGDAAAKTDLRDEISERIDYYVGTGTSSDRALKYTELDVYNESYHTGPNAPSSPTDLRHNYWNVYGAAGVADIYREARDSAPAGVKMYVNEYGVLGGNDYANWYSQHTEAIRAAGRAAGYGEVVGGIGIQHYSGGAGAQPARNVMSGLQNLATQGLPITLTEFGVNAGVDSATAGGIMETMMRLVFGTPNAAGFMMWGFHAENGGSNLFAPSAALYTVNTSDWNTWTLTAAGKEWQDLLGIQDWDGNPNNAWDTDFTTVADAGGTISIPAGFFGDYYLSGQTANALNAKVLPFDFALTKGTTAYAQALAKPPTWFLWKTNGGGTWGAGANWTDAPESGGTPNAAGYTAYFGSTATTYNLTTGAPTVSNVTSATTVTVASNVTAGMLVFDNAAGYRITGAGTITLRGFDQPTGHAAAIRVVAGSHTIDAPLILADDTTLQVVPPGAVLTLAALQESPVRVSKTGLGTVRVNAMRASSLSVDEGSLRIIPGSASQNAARSLTIAGQGTFDLADGSLAIDDLTQAAAVRGYVATAYAAGDWTGPGLTSSAAAADANHMTALGVGEAGGKLLVRYTWSGDANLDGVVDASDLAAVLGGLGAGGSGATWTTGDFNYDGRVSPDDLALFSLAVAGSGGRPIASVPEPLTSCAAVCGFSLLVIRRRPAQR